MLHEPTAHLWGTQPGFTQAIRQWTWGREHLPPLIQRLASADAPAAPANVDLAALAQAFWTWAATLDHNAHLQALDPVDHAHFQVGVLLSQWLVQRPLRLPDPQRSEEVRVMTATALTLLAAWRKALDSPPLAGELQMGTPARWSSYVENVAEDPALAIAFLDLFTGREPVWRFPSLPSERPVLRRALEMRRLAG